MTRTSPRKTTRPDESGASDDGELSVVRTGLAAVLAVAGIAWLVFVTAFVSSDGTPAAVADLGRWAYLIGFAGILAALLVASHDRAPLGRGRGIVIGMLGCFLVGLLWICTYYVVGVTLDVPLMTELSQYNLMVGIAFMAVGFVFATKWE